MIWNIQVFFYFKYKIKETIYINKIYNFKNIKYKFSYFLKLKFYRNIYLIYRFKTILKFLKIKKNYFIYFYFINNIFINNDYSKLILKKKDSRLDE